jgi:peptidoglycan DL-endopeptidase CwlO
VVAVSSSQRSKVVAFARKQIGQPYLWLGDGILKPGFDCSGLTLMAWLQAGVILPHNSGQQAVLLHAVAYTKATKSRLQLGDVIFYYGSVDEPASISHCAIYTGVNAEDGLKEVVAAVDTAHGVMQHDMFWALAPCGFGFVGHS